MTNLEGILESWRNDRLPVTIAARTRRVYDAVSFIYPVSSLLFHSRAHREAIALSEIANGASVLEIAVGSGEMFSRIASVNPNGKNVGVDLSPAMAAATHRRAAKKHPGVHCALQAVDCRAMPFRDQSFDHVVCCYLLELLDQGDIHRTLEEVQRVLRPDGKLTLILIGQNRRGFNRAYHIASRIAPAFWGRQVNCQADEMLLASGFRILRSQEIQQWFYPSRVVIARR